MERHSPHSPNPGGTALLFCLTHNVVFTDSVYPIYDYVFIVVFLTLCSLQPANAILPGLGLFHSLLYPNTD